MSSKKHWNEFPIQPLHPHEEKLFMSGAKLIAKWGMTPKQLAELLKEENFLSYVSPFYENPDDACERDILSLQFDPEALIRYAKIFMPEKVYSEPPSQRSAKYKADKNQDMQRRYWKTRAVASVLWEETKDLSIERMAEQRELHLYGCEESSVDHGIIKTWIRDLCPCKEADPDYVATQCEKPEKPVMKPTTQRRFRCRAIAELLWKRPANQKLNIKAMCERDEIVKIGCENKKYGEKILRGYIKDLCPEPRRGAPRKNVR